MYVSLLLKILYLAEERHGFHNSHSHIIKKKVRLVWLHRDIHTFIYERFWQFTFRNNWVVFKRDFSIRGRE